MEFKVRPYLTNRTYQVRVGKKLSETFNATGGLPQGSILSPLFFNIMLSNLPTCPSFSTRGVDPFFGLGEAKKKNREAAEKLENKIV